MEKMVLQGGWDNSSIPPLPGRPPVPNRRTRRPGKRKLAVVITGVIILVLALTGGTALAFFKFNPTLLSNVLHHGGQNYGQKYQHNTMAYGSPTATMTTGMNNMPQGVTTINNLNRISVVGSTAFIVDGHGRTIATDANPYGVALAPASVSASKTPGSLKPGDIVVTNIGANDTGTTIVRFPAGKGPGLLFNTTASAGTKGPAFEAFNTVSGTDWVANISGNNVQVFRPDGTILTTITSPLFNKPWGVTSNHGMHNAMDGAVGSFFVSNVADATIIRVDVIPAKNGATFRFFQIGQLTQMNDKKTKLNMVWVPSLQIGGKKYSDVLLVLDIANNRVAAYANSTTLNTTNMRSTNKGMTVFQGKPLNTPGGIAINPLNGDLLVANLNDNNLVELNLSQGKAVGTKLLDNAPVDARSGNGSALFGIAATVDARNNLEVFFVDDNMNTLNVLSM